MPGRVALITLPTLCPQHPFSAFGCGLFLAVLSGLSGMITAMQMRPHPAPPAPSMTASPTTGLSSPPYWRAMVESLERAGIYGDTFHLSGAPFTGTPTSFVVGDPKTMTAKVYGATEGTMGKGWHRDAELLDVQAKRLGFSVALNPGELFVKKQAPIVCVLSIAELPSAVYQVMRELHLQVTPPKSKPEPASN